MNRLALKVSEKLVLCVAPGQGLGHRSVLLLQSFRAVASFEKSPERSENLQTWCLVRGPVLCFPNA